jgi:hypothetical protein
MNVYKFRGGSKKIFKRDLDCLINNYAWYSKLSEQNDLLEGSVDHDYLRNQVLKLHANFKAKNPNLNDQQLKVLFNALDHFLLRRDKVGIYALSTNYTNEPLWAYYGDNHKGFCIEYNFDLLSIETENSKIYSVKVEYSKEKPRLTTSDLNKLLKGNEQPLIEKLLATKSQRWGNEEEIRLISDALGVNYFDPSSIKSIYFGKKMKKKRKKAIMNELKDRNINFFKMVVDEENYGLKPVEAD